MFIQLLQDRLELLAVRDNHQINLSVQNSRDILFCHCQEPPTQI